MSTVKIILTVLQLLYGLAVKVVVLIVAPSNELGGVADMLELVLLGGV